MKNVTGLLILTLFFAWQCHAADVQKLTATTQKEFIAPEIHTGTHFNVSPVSGKTFMAVTANRHATLVASKILEQGGTAIDAAIAAQMVLGLVEPQSSGIGGGAFLLYFDASHQQLHYYDGREKAPANINAHHFLEADEPLNFLDAVVGGHAVGVPGLLRMLEKAHAKHGKQHWATLFEPAIHLSKTGFPVSPRLHNLLTGLPAADNSEAFNYYFFKNGKAPAIGSILKNPAYAKTLKTIAAQGADAFYRGEIAVNLIDALQYTRRKSKMTLNDLANYQSLERPALCMNYRKYKVCGAAPPSSGGTTVLAILGILENFNISSMNEAVFIHHYIEASRLAFADRNIYVADPVDMMVSADQLVAKPYLKKRAALINPIKRTDTLSPGQPGPVPINYTQGITPELPSTTQISIIDSYGNALSMTSSIETAFGSRVMTGGFLLNNQLTDFSFLPESSNGELVANRPAPGKRPRSSMSPSIIFNSNDQPFLITGSPGGARIIDYTVLHLLRVIDRNTPPDEAMLLPHVVAFPDRLELENTTTPYASSLLTALVKMKHRPVIKDQSSGLNVIKIENALYTGYSDPRREGVALGQ